MRLIDGSGPHETLCLRRSPRLAAKIRGHKKSSLQRAQDLVCKKLKIARLTSKAFPRSAVLNAVKTPTRSTPPNEDLGAPLPPRDTAHPLTQEEIHLIMDACGIVDKGKKVSDACGIVDKGKKVSDSPIAPPKHGPCSNTSGTLSIRL